MHSTHQVLAIGKRAGAELVLGAALLGACAGTWAQEWPNKPVRLVVGLAPGSGTDTIARMLAPKLEAVWKQPVIVENKPGAGTVLAAEYVANATDRHTFLLGSVSSLLPKFTMKNLRYDPVTDLVPIYRIVNYQLVIATNAATARKAPTLRELVALSKSTPQGLFFASLGPTSIYTGYMSLLNQSLGIQYSGVDYNGVPAMNMAVLRNDAQLLINAPSLLKGQLDSGELLALAAISKERYPNLPDVPTLQEAVGYRGFIPFSWAALLGPKTTSAAIVEQVGRDLRTVIQDPEFKKLLEARVSGTVLDSSPAQFGKEYREEALVWKNLFDTLKIKPQ